MQTHAPAVGAPTDGGRHAPPLTQTTFASARRTPVPERALRFKREHYAQTRRPQSAREKSGGCRHRAACRLPHLRARSRGLPPARCRGSALAHARRAAPAGGRGPARARTGGGCGGARHHGCDGARGAAGASRRTMRTTTSTTSGYAAAQSASASASCGGCCDGHHARCFAGCAARCRAHSTAGCRACAVCRVAGCASGGESCRRRRRLFRQHLRLRRRRHLRYQKQALDRRPQRRQKRPVAGPTPCPLRARPAPRLWSRPEQHPRQPLQLPPPCAHAPAAQRRTPHKAWRWPPRPPVARARAHPRRCPAGGAFCKCPHSRQGTPTLL